MISNKKPVIDKTSFPPVAFSCKICSENMPTVLWSGSKRGKGYWRTWNMACVSTRLGTQNQFWPASVLGDGDVLFCLRYDTEFCCHLRCCTYHNAFFSKHFLIIFIHIPCPAWGKVRFSAVCHTYTVISLLSPLHNHLLLPSAFSHLNSSAFLKGILATHLNA